MGALAAILALSLLGPALPVIRPPVAVPVRAALVDGALGLTWPAPVGQRFACAYRLSGTDEPLRCLIGEGGAMDVPAAPRDAALVTAAGDVVEVRSYGDGGWTLAYGRAVVSDGWLTWLPEVGR